MGVSFLICGNFRGVKALHRLEMHLLLEENKILNHSFEQYFQPIYFSKLIHLRKDVKAFIKNEHFG